MSATTTIYEGNGASISYTLITNGRFNCSDAHTPVLDTPNKVATSGLMQSWWKSWALDMAGSFTQIDNISVYCDGAIGWTFGTGGKVQVGLRDSGDNGCPEVSYQQAAGSAATGYAIDVAVNGHAYYLGQSPVTADIEDYTSGSELELDTDAYTTADKSKLLVAQLVIDDDATAGAQAAETITFAYDEI